MHSRRTGKVRPAPNAGMWILRKLSLFAVIGLFWVGGTATVSGQSLVGADAGVATPRPAGWQRGEGQPYEVAGSEVWSVPDPVSGRDYQVFVALPASYAEQPERRYPVLYVTDADYAFPLLRQISRRLNVEGPRVEDFILVGLSYAKGDGGMQSRRRDYTPTPSVGTVTCRIALAQVSAFHFGFLSLAEG